MSYAPIILFTYSRKDHTMQAVDSLLKNKESSESDLFIFSDGPKTREKEKAVKENREYIHSIKGFKSVTITERETNWGLANSLIAGITEVIDKYGRAIIVEDDLLLSPYFLKFMNDGLDMYKDDEEVAAISGFLYPMKEKMSESFFLRYFHCWGWATWKDSWHLLNTNTKELLRKIRWKTRKFNLDNSFNYYGMLYCQKVGLVDSWYIRLYASFYLAKKLILFPNQSLVENHGFDGSGTHSNKNDTVKTSTMSQSPIEIKKTSIVENRIAYQSLCNYFKSKNRQKTIKKYYNNLKVFIRKLLLIDCR